MNDNTKHPFWLPASDLDVLTMLGERVNLGVFNDLVVVEESPEIWNSGFLEVEKHGVFAQKNVYDLAYAPCNAYFMNDTRYSIPVLCCPKQEELLSRARAYFESTGQRRHFWRVPKREKPLLVEIETQDKISAGVIQYQVTNSEMLQKTEDGRKMLELITGLKKLCRLA